MVIKTRLTEKDFINVNFVMMLKKPLIKIIYIIMGLSALLGIIDAILPLAVLGEFSISRIISPLFILVFFPSVIYFAAKKNYSSNQRISETIEYKFEKYFLKIQGESFNSQLTWDKIYKVTQTKKWILIWQSRQLANAIHKSDIWEGEMNDLKQILTSHRVKNNLS